MSKLYLTEVIETFPSVRIPSVCGGLPVDVSLIAQLGHGSGDHLFSSIAVRQRAHQTFVDALDEPSAQLAGTDFSKGDPTSLYSFMVGAQGHPFHRHAGHRIFTAVSGSGGAQLRFSTASTHQIAEDPYSFVRALRCVNIPADCLFTVRFGGEVWHQFSSLSPHSPHPVFFALSCHTNELGGDLPEKMRKKVLGNTANIPELTELLSPDVSRLLESVDFKMIPATTLSLDAPAGTAHRFVCDVTRSRMGLLRGAWGVWKKASGFLSKIRAMGAVKELKSLPDDSLLRQHLSDQRIYHEDAFSLSVHNTSFNRVTASQFLAATLEGFLQNAPRTVSRLMLLRNALVKPWRLRTSHLGCPVSSLLSEGSKDFFADKYPVLDQSMNAADTQAQVILGADDKHLIFRSCVGVRIFDDNRIEITMGNRVHCKNLFGRFYMSVIDAVHRRYVTPTMLRMAANYAMAQRYDGEGQSL